MKTPTIRLLTLLPWVTVALASPAALAQEKTPPTAQAIPLAQPRSLSADPYLRSMLPEGSFAYVRVPSPWGFIGEPKGNLFDSALQAASLNKAIDALRGAVRDNIVTPLRAETGPVPELLLNQLRSPLEVVALAPKAAGKPSLEVLLTARLASTTPAEANEVLRAITQAVPTIQVKTPLDNKGLGDLQWGKARILAQFDAPSQRLSLLLTESGDGGILKKRFAALQARTETAMSALEAEIDQSGQGLFLWVDVNAAMGAQQALPRELLALPILLKMYSVNGLAAGTGVSAGKGRLKVLLETPLAGVRALFPPIAADFSFKTAGEPYALAMLGVPSGADWKNAEQFLRTVVPDWDTSWPRFEGAVRVFTGINFEDWLNLFGPELVYVADAAGVYGALRIRDQAKFAELLALLQKRLGFRYETRTIAGNTYSHLISPDFSSGINKPSERLAVRFASLASGLPTHLYWKAEGDYLILAEIPQILIDRDRHEPKILARSWLEDSQRVSANDALLLLSFQAEGVPRLLYHENLKALQILGGLTTQPVDLFEIPTTSQLNLPKRGSYSAKLTSNERLVALELVYENNPVEFVLAGSGMATVATVGILAAIAIPAYQDYTIRARVSNEIAQMAGAKVAMTEFYMTNGRFPSEQDLPGFRSSLAGSGPSIERLDIEPGTGKLGLRVENAALDAQSNQVVLTPTPAGGTITWTCSGTLAPKYLPKACRP